MQKEDNAEGEVALVLVRATEEEIRQWQAADAERKRDAIVKAAGAHLRPSACGCTPAAMQLCNFVL